jgi:hypothetical protein
MLLLSKLLMADNFEYIHIDSEFIIKSKLQDEQISKLDIDSTKKLLYVFTEKINNDSTRRIRLYRINTNLRQDSLVYEFNLPQNNPKTYQSHFQVYKDIIYIVEIINNNTQVFNVKIKRVINEKIESYASTIKVSDFNYVNKAVIKDVEINNSELKLSFDIMSEYLTPPEYLKLHNSNIAIIDIKNTKDTVKKNISEICYKTLNDKILSYSFDYTYIHNKSLVTIFDKSNISFKDKNKYIVNLATDNKSLNGTFSPPSYESRKLEAYYPDYNFTQIIGMTNDNDYILIKSTKDNNISVLSCITKETISKDIEVYKMINSKPLLFQLVYNEYYKSFGIYFVQDSSLVLRTYKPLINNRDSVVNVFNDSMIYKKLPLSKGNYNNYSKNLDEMLLSDGTSIMYLKGNGMILPNQIIHNDIGPFLDANRKYKVEYSSTNQLKISSLYINNKKYNVDNDNLEFSLSQGSYTISHEYIFSDLSIKRKDFIVKVVDSVKANFTTSITKEKKVHNIKITDNSKGEIIERKWYLNDSLLTNEKLENMSLKGFGKYVLKLVARGLNTKDSMVSELYFDDEENRFITNKYFDENRYEYNLFEYGIGNSILFNQNGTLNYTYIDNGNTKTRSTSQFIKATNIGFLNLNNSSVYIPNKFDFKLKYNLYCSYKLEPKNIAYKQYKNNYLIYNNINYDETYSGPYYLDTLFNSTKRVYEMYLIFGKFYLFDLIVDNEKYYTLLHVSTKKDVPQTYFNYYEIDSSSKSIELKDSNSKYINVKSLPSSSKELFISDKYILIPNNDSIFLLDKNLNTFDNDVRRIYLLNSYIKGKPYKIIKYNNEIVYLKITFKDYFELVRYDVLSQDLKFTRVMTSREVKTKVTQNGEMMVAYDSLSYVKIRRFDESLEKYRDERFEIEGYNIKLHDFEELDTIGNFKFLMQVIPEIIINSNVISQSQNLVLLEEIAKVGSLTNIQAENEKDLMLLSPNPVSEYIELKVLGDYLIYNLQGRIVLRGENTGDRIDISRIDSGIYFISIGNNTMKFIKK